MVDAALASTAAPTFFPPVEIRDSRGFVYQCVDGGMHENNPVFSALAFTIRNYRTEFKSNLDLSSVKMLSLGTGRKNNITSFDVFRRSGFCGLIRPIIEISMDGTSEAADRNIALILGEENENYLRIQIELDEQDSKMDDPAIVDKLHGKANHFCSKDFGFKKFLQDLSCRQLLTQEERGGVDSITKSAKDVLNLL